MDSVPITGPRITIWCVQYEYQFMVSDQILHNHPRPAAILNLLRAYVYYQILNPIPHGGRFSLCSRGGVDLTCTCLTASEGPAKHILCNIF